MGNGCLYVNIFYPYYIGVKEGSIFNIPINMARTPKNEIIQNIFGKLQIRKHIKSVTVLDCNNEISKTKKSSKEVTTFQLRKTMRQVSENNIAFSFFNDIACVLEKDHYLREFKHKYLTEIIICYEVNDAEAIGDKDLDLYIHFLEHFLHLYRYATKDCNVLLYDSEKDNSPIIRYASHKYTVNETKLSLVERLDLNRKLKYEFRKFYQGGYTKGLVSIKHDLTKISDEIKELLEKQIVLSDEDILLLKAIEQLVVYKEYRYVVLNACTALEFFLTRYHCLYLCSQGKFEWKFDISGNVLKDLISKIIKEPTEKHLSLIKNTQTIRDLRNKIIFSPYKPSESEAEFSIYTISEFIYLLKTDYPIKLCNLKDDELYKLLVKFDQELAKDEIPAIQRSVRVVEKLQNHLNIIIPSFSNLWTKVNEFVNNLYPERDLIIPPLHRGVFYFQGVIYEIQIGMIFGKVTMEISTYLKDMPNLKYDQLKNSEEYGIYIDQCCDLLDFGLGFQHFENDNSFNEDVKDFVTAGKAQLNSMTETLLSVTNKDASSIDALMGTEMLLKACLLNSGSTISRVKKLSHNLNKIADAIQENLPQANIMAIKNAILNIPQNVSNRYKNMNYSTKQLGLCAMSSQFIAGEVLRILTKIDSRKTLKIGKEEMKTRRAFP